jgi:hypothetical protein
VHHGGRTGELTALLVVLWFAVAFAAIYSVTRLVQGQGPNDWNRVGAVFTAVVALGVVTALH